MVDKNDAAPAGDRGGVSVSAQEHDSRHGSLVVSRLSDVEPREVEWLWLHNKCTLLPGISASLMPDAAA